MTAIICARCGEANNSGAIFCKNCGERIHEGDEFLTYSTQANAPAQADPRSAPVPVRSQSLPAPLSWLDRDFSAALLIFGVGLAVVLVTAAILFVKSRGDGGQPPAEEAVGTPLDLPTQSSVIETATISQPLESQIISSPAIAEGSGTGSQLPIQTTEESLSSPEDGICVNPEAPRLKVGANAQVIPGNGRNNIRKNPSLSARIIGKAEEGGYLRVLEGPACDYSIIWWRVQVVDTGVIGWTAEVRDGDYYLRPGQ